MPEQPPGTDELLEQMRRVDVADVVLAAAASIAQVAYLKLDPASRDLDQARLAVDTLRGLVDALEPVHGERARDLRQTVTNLQLAYAAAASDAPAPQAPVEG